MLFFNHPFEGATSSVLEEKKSLVDVLLKELHRGNFRPAVLTSQPMREVTEKPAPPAPLASGSAHFPFASTLAKLPSITPVMSAPCIGSFSPERDVDGALELSRISLIGTPMMNRPNSEMFDEDITITAPKPVTSSGRDFLQILKIEISFTTLKI